MELRRCLDGPRGLLHRFLCAKGGGNSPQLQCRSCGRGCSEWGGQAALSGDSRVDRDRWLGSQVLAYVGAGGSFLTQLSSRALGRVARVTGETPTWCVCGRGAARWAPTGAGPAPPTLGCNRVLIRRGGSRTRSAATLRAARPFFPHRDGGGRGGSAGGRTPARCTPSTPSPGASNTAGSPGLGGHGARPPPHACTCRL